MFKNKLSKKSNKSYEDIHHTCTIRFLDDSEPLSVSFQKDTRGQWLIDHVCKQLNLVEQDYFGLRFVDADKQRHWLDPWKYVYRQLKNVNPMVLCFRAKFYPMDPLKLKEEITRYFLFLQLRRDLHHGRLLCSPADANLLAAYIIQSEVGDYDPEDHAPGYVTEFKMLPKQTAKQEEKIAELHKSLSSQVPSEAEGLFLQKSASLDTYGVDPHPVKDQRGNQMYLGVTHLGIVTFQGNKRTHLFKWPQITKIAFEGKMFIVHVTISEGEENSLYFKRKKHACGFKCPSFSACKHLWKCAVEQQYFFTLGASSEAPKVTSGGGIFTRGSKFRFSGRCQKEVYSESASISREEPHFTRTSSNPNFVRAFGKLRSASLPSKLKEHSLNKSMSDVILDGNHISSSVSMMEPGSKSLPLGDSYTEQVEPSIPEERSVDIGETPYNPLNSPTREDMPPLHGAVSRDESPPLNSELDTQIKQKEGELRRLRRDVNHVSRDTAPISLAAPSVPTAGSNHAREPPASQSVDEPDVGAPTQPSAMSSAHTAPQRRGLALCRAITLTLVIVFTAMLVVLMVALESELDVPVLRDIRAMPEVQDFKNHHYDPLKMSVTQKVGGMFKS